MQFFATILICAGTLGPAECQTDTALSVVSMPEPAQGLVECMLHGQAYVAEAGLVGPTERVKVRCTPATGMGNERHA